uniref:Uncharacterized protein n=1 Tax=Panagrolaimus davidi TaxID=227884 RepID=A0A914P052_9BILA
MFHVEVFLVLVPQGHATFRLQIGRLEYNDFNLSETDFKKPVFPLVGVIRGKSRLIISLPCQLDLRGKKCFNVNFIVDCGSPETFLSKKSFLTLLSSKSLKLPHFDSVPVKILVKL